MKKAAVVHTTPVTIPTLKQLIMENTAEEVEVINFLDDSMLPEINRAGRITEGVKYRLNSLLMLAQAAGADAVLCACSSIGSLAEEGRAFIRIPVLRVDAPMAERAAGYGRIGVAATLQSTILPTTDLIGRLAGKAGKNPQIQSMVIEGVGNLLAQGRGDEYDRIVSGKLKELLAQNDVVVLAQASMARAAECFPEEEKRRLLTSPVSGAQAFCRCLEKAGER